MRAVKAKALRRMARSLSTKPDVLVKNINGSFVYPEGSFKRNLKYLKRNFYLMHK